MPKRTDENQRIIVAALRQFGASVQDIHMVGHGCPDLLVSYRNKNYLFEVKCGNALPQYAMGYDRQGFYYIRCRKCGKYVFTNADISVVRDEMVRLNERPDSV